ncbi:MAG: TetR/AcrR family transcriptional regulator [Spirochaetales bacterium]
MSEDTKQRIVEAAHGRLFTQGYGATRLEQIASDVGITKKTLYLHFRSKQEIMRAAIKYGSTLWLGQAEQIITNPERTFPEKFRALSEHAVLTMRARERAFDEPLGKRVGQAELKELANQSIRNRVVGVLRVMLEQGIELGLLRDDIEVERTSYALLNMVTGLAQLSTFEDVPFSASQLLSASLRMLRRGLLTEDGLATLSDQTDDGA